MDYRKRIEIRPGVHFGQPCVGGTRIPVADVLQLVQEGVPFGEIVASYYPDLEVADVKACVQYAAEIVRTEEIHAADA